MDRIKAAAHPALAALAVLTAALLLSCARQPVHAAAPMEGGYVVINTASLVVNTPAFYTFSSDGLNINFFVIHDGHAAVSYFDSCRTCYRSKRGYAFSDGTVLCRKCNMVFNLNALDKGIGGCYPVRLEGSEANGFYRIPVAALKEHADLF